MLCTFRLVIVVVAARALLVPPCRRRRLTRMFASLYRCLRRGARYAGGLRRYASGGVMVRVRARAVLQLYPETAEQLELIMTTAMKCGFKGGLVVDYPNRCVHARRVRPRRMLMCLGAPSAATVSSTRARKHYLCLIAGVTAPLPAPLLGDAGGAPRVVSRGS